MTVTTRYQVASADSLATQAGLRAFALGGNAVDAAIATSAAIAVAGPHMCGLGGDLFALVHEPGRPVTALNASGRAGSGADAGALRAASHAQVPFTLDIASVTVPGYVDGLLALHQRYATLPLDVLIDPAIDLAENGFPASPLLAGAIARLGGNARTNLHELVTQATGTGARVRRPGAARALRSILSDGRNGFYEGEFGAGLLTIGAGLFTADDLASSNADWVTPLTASVWGHDIATIPPNSQGYLTLGALLLLADEPLPDPDDPLWAHLLIEANTAAGHDRPAVLHEHADGRELLRDICQRRSMIDRQRASARPLPAASGDTTTLCTMEAGGLAVSLIQSNASGFGSGLVEPNTQINLHNRGIGFTLQAGHPAELGPRRRPPHTLSPALIRHAGDIRAVVATMGGDAQPQIMTQLIARLVHHNQRPSKANDAARFALAGPDHGFDTWTTATPTVQLEAHAPPSWATELARHGHRVAIKPRFDSAFGHANLIEQRSDGLLAGSADRRSVVGAAAGI